MNGTRRDIAFLVLGAIIAGVLIFAMSEVTVNKVEDLLRPDKLEEAQTPHPRAEPPQETKKYTSEQEVQRPIYIEGPKQVDCTNTRDLQQAINTLLSRIDELEKSMKNEVYVVRKRIDDFPRGISKPQLQGTLREVIDQRECITYAELRKHLYNDYKLDCCDP